MITNILVFSPHPDDAELCIGGFIIKHLKDYKITIVNMTNGEKGTNGCSEQRREESLRIESKYSNLNYIFLDIPDLQISSVDNGQRETVIKLLRSLKPSIICNMYEKDRHPDHMEASKLVKYAVEIAGIEKYKNWLGGPHTVKYILNYSQDYIEGFGLKSILFDLTSVYKQKLDMIENYGSQFSLNENGKKTILNTMLVNRIRKKDEYLGSLINCDFAEQLVLEKGVMSTDNIFKVLS